MRRGRITFLAAALTAAVSFAVVPGALAATPQDICKDLQDGKIDGSYTPAEWTAFFQDASVQGYCSPIVVITPPPVTPSTPSTPPQTPSTPSGPPVSLTPTPTTGVSGATVAQHATATPTQAHVKGASHTVQTPKGRTAAPLGTSVRTGTLPFTGAQLTVFALVALGLIGSGLVLRATGRRRSEK